MSTNPYVGPNAESDPLPEKPIVKRFKFPIGMVVLGALLSVLLVALFLPLTRGSAGGARRRHPCINNLREIALGIMNYESAYGTLPPAFTVDAEGNRLHSWRTLILPYIGEVSIYRSIDLTKPWDHPANAKAREAVVAYYACPSTANEEHLTTYLAVVGPSCVFTGSTPRKLNEITDGASKTLAVIDANSDQAVHWMSPHDADEDIVMAFHAESETNHRGIFVAAFLDGHVTSIPLDTKSAGVIVVLGTDGQGLSPR